MAVAMPVSGITVDGNLQDWPDGLPTYAVDPEGATARNFRGTFRVGFDRHESCLYVAVQVEDDRVVTDGKIGKACDVQDSCEVYLEPLHGKTRGAASCFFYRGAYGAFPGPREAFDPASERQADAAQAARAIDEHHIAYEWRIDLKRLSGKESPPGIGAVVGFDVVFFDRDDDDTVMYHLWGPSKNNRTDDSLQLADLILVDREPQLGKLTGQVAWKNNSLAKPNAFPQVSIQSLEIPGLRVQTSCDSKGKFSVALPAGVYSINPVDTIELRVSEITAVTATVVATKSVEADALEVTSLPKPRFARKVGVLREPGPINAEELDRVVQANMDYGHIPGLSIAVIKDAKVVYSKAFGVKDSVTGEPVLESTLFEACSLTKPIFAFAVNRLAERGAIDLDKPLSEYCPNSLRVSDVRADERLSLISARQVLAHRTGFPNWRGDKLSIDFTPGSRFGYSGEGFEYLNEVVSQITGKPSEEVLSEEALTPLNMTSASAVCDDAIARMSAIGHDAARPLAKWMPKSPVMAASLHVNAEDYAQFLLALLNRSGMSDEQWQEMLRPQFVDVDPNSERPFCLGIGVEETPYGKKYSHSGLNLGFTCYFAVYDEPKFGYVFFLNNQQAGDFNAALQAYLVTGTTNNDDKSVE
jgi:CubicO group peptidase (beta-lactamase class C family)